MMMMMLFRTLSFYIILYIFSVPHFLASQEFSIFKRDFCQWGTNNSFFLFFLFLSYQCEIFPSFFLIFWFLGFF